MWNCPLQLRTAILVRILLHNVMPKVVILKAQGRHVKWSFLAFSGRSLAENNRITWWMFPADKTTAGAECHRNQDFKLLLWVWCRQYSKTSLRDRSFWHSCVLTHVLGCVASFSVLLEIAKNCHQTLPGITWNCLKSPENCLKLPEKAPTRYAKKAGCLHT